MTYTSTIEEVNSTRRKINFSVESAMVKQKINTVTTEMQTTSEIRGFRKGKAPLSIVRKFYMNDIVKKAADQIINEAYSSTLKTLDFQIISQPEIEPENQFSEESEFKFSAVVDINPKLEMTDYKNISLKLPEILKTNLDEHYENLLKTYKKSFGLTNTVEGDKPAQKGDYVKVNYTLSCDGTILEGKTAENEIIELDHSIFPELESSIIGMKPSETKLISVKIPENYRDQALQGKTVEFNLTLKSIETLKESDFEEELAKRLNFPDMETAKKSILSTLENNQNEMKVNSSFDQIVEHVLAKNSFEVADSLIENTIDKAIEEANAANPSVKIDPKNAQQRESFRDVAIKNVRGILALGHIARQEEVSVQDEELYQKLMAFIQTNKIDPSVFQKNTSQFIEEFRGQVLMNKVILKLVNMAQIEYTQEPKA